MADPILPTSFVDTDTMPTVDGSTFTVNAGQSVQTAINNAAAANGNLTHEVVLQAGATFNENLILPVKSSGTGWVIIRTANLAGIAVQRQRIIRATHAAAMPKIQLSPAPIGVDTDAGANHFRFIGIEFIVVGGSGSPTGFRMFSGFTSNVADIPHHIVLDRCIFRNTFTTHKLVALQGGAGTAVIDSSLVLNPAQDGDSNALWLYDGPGPMKVVNNDIAGLGEVVFFGAAGYAAGFLPQDIEFRRNLVRAEPIVATPGKNLIEFKQGLRIWFQGNIVQDGSMIGQSYNIMMSPQDEGIVGPTAVVDDILWEYNLFRRLRAGFALSGQGFGQTGVHMHRVAIRHNFIDSVGDYGGSGHQAVYNNGTDQVTVDHNTVRNGGGNGVRFEGGAPNTNWIHRNTIVQNDVVSAAGGGTGTTALNTHTTGRVFNKNVLVGAVGTYTGTDLSQNFFPGSISLNPDGSLPVGSPYKNQATDGTDIGADFTTLYGTTSGIGQFGAGANDFYAFTGQWPVGGPSLSSISPTSRTRGDGAFTLTANGSSFDATAVVRWSGNNRSTTFVSGTQVTAVIPADDIVSTGSVSVTVFVSPNATGAQTFTVNTPAAPTTNPEFFAF